MEMMLIDLHPNRSKKRGFIVKKSLIVLICIILSLGIVMGWSSPSNAQNINDIKKILQLSDQVIQGEKDITLSIRSSYKSYNNSAELKQIGMEASKGLGLSPDGINVSHNDYICKTRSPQDGMMVSATLVGLKDKTTLLIVKLEANSQTSISSLEEKMLKYGEKLRALGISANWNITIQGDVMEEGDQLWKIFTETLEAQEIGRYKDVGTTSVSFYSPVLGTSIKSGEDMMNFQAAVHQNSLTHEKRVTLGMPIITSS